MTLATITDRNRWQLQPGSRRIPCDARVGLSEAQELIGQANVIWQTTRSEVEALRARAWEEGRQAGFEETVTKMASDLARLRQQSREYREHSEQRLCALSAEMIRRILPNLPRDQVLKDLLTSALRAAVGDRVVRIRVNPSAVEAVQQQLASAALTSDDCIVVADPDLEPFGCVLESEAGTIDAGLETQIQSLERAARLATGARE